jgi:ssDNA-binding Zn-finger/Zn-ribbon topoisomerase 1
MVRCFNCGAFLRQDIADKYAAMQTKPASIILSEVPAGEMHSVGDVDDDGGFELQILEAKAAGEDSAAVYSLQSPTPPAPKVAASAPVAKAAAAAPPPRAAAEEGGVSHSVATAGDVLLQAALSEQADERKRRKDRGVSLRGGARTPGGFVIYCPYGCRIEVKDQHRGMTGSCPKCRAPFVVPVDPPDYGHRERAAEQAARESSTSPTGVWVPWFEDQHLHNVAPEKLKLKAGSLTKEFLEVDLGLSPQGLLLLSLAPKKQAPTFGGGSGTDKKKPEARAAVFAHLREDKPASEAPANAVRIYRPEELSQMQVAQPAANPLQSMFAGIAVFGEKQIAVQLPLTDGQPPQFLSFGLLGFRKFAEALKLHCGVELTAVGVPMQDQYVDLKCHYTDVPIRSLQNLDWYQADPSAGVTLAGWKCAACGLAISEEARKKENIGGKGGKSIAKATCPKCNNKFGEQPLHTLPSQLAVASMAEGAAS